VVEEIGFFGDDPHMFGCAHIPSGDIVGAVVLCSSTHAELLKAYHLEVLLARALARSGIAVQRFHYRGDGNSAGLAGDLNMPAMITAAREARDRLTERTGIEDPAYVGVRLGGFPATRLAEESGGGSLLLWDPVLDADLFMREAVRSHAISALKGDAKPEKTEQLMERLKNEGVIELLGYEITSVFHKSISGKRLIDNTPTGSKVLVVPFGSTNMEPLIEAWSTKDVDVSQMGGTNREAWWLDEQASEDRHHRGQVLVSGSAKWLTALTTG
jgi:hypothetical protein